MSRSLPSSIATAEPHAGAAGASLLAEAKERIYQIVRAERLGPGGRLPSIRHISAKTGISPTTVANGVAEMVREGILRSHHGKGVYLRSAVPATEPRALRTAYLLSVHKPPSGLRGYMLHNPFWSAILAGVQEELAEQCGTIRLRFSLLNSFLQEARGTPGDRPWGEVGFIIIHEADGRQIRQLSRLSRTIIQVHGKSRSKLVSSIRTHAGLGAEMLTEHLISLGHRRIAFCGLTHGCSLDADKYQVFRRTMQKHGLNVAPELISEIDYTSEDGYRIVGALLKRTPRPTAIVMGNDISAMGALRVIHDAGLSVPDDISVAGFDNIDMSRFSRPSLTTVAMRMDEMGRIAVRRLLEVHADGPREPVVLRPELIVRESTGPVKGTE